MATNLVDLIKGYLTPDIVKKASTFVGESESATQKAVSGIVPALLAAMANQTSTTDGAERLSRMLDTGKYDGSALNNLGSLFSGGEATQKAITEGKNVLGSLLGGKTQGLTDQIASFAGVKAGSAGSLLALILPLIMNLLGRQRSTIGQGPSALASLLGEQKSFLSGLLPAGIGSFLGWPGSAPMRSYAEPKRATPWLVPLIALGAIVLVGLGWLLSRPNPGSETTVAARAVAKMTDLKLSCGVNISVPEGSFNYSLYMWLSCTTDTYRTIRLRQSQFRNRFDAAHRRICPNRRIVGDDYEGIP